MQARICDETALKLYDRRKNNLVNIMTDSIIDWVITTYDHFETVSWSHKWKAKRRRKVEKHNFFNFSCIFLNANIFFQLEF